MTPDDAANTRRIDRRARLAATLRENLKRRKAQARSRSAPRPAETDPAVGRAGATAGPDDETS